MTPNLPSPEVPRDRANAEVSTFSYAVRGMRLGDRIRFDSSDYREYECNSSDQFEKFYWLHKTRTERERRGSFTASYSLLHSTDGTAVYINRSQEPAFWSSTEVKDDIEQLSRQFKEWPRTISMPTRSGLPKGTLAIWGKVTLERIDNTSRDILATGQSPKIGILVDFIGTLCVRQNSVYLFTEFLVVALASFGPLATISMGVAPFGFSR